MKDNGLKLYRRTRQPDKTGDKSLKSLVQEQFTDGSIVTQPVFEQGQALLIPSAEIIVGFDSSVMSVRQRDLLSPIIRTQGISNLRELGDKSALLTINNPGDGRCYQVCREIIKISGVAFAEPNHLVIMLDEHDKQESI